MDQDITLVARRRAKEVIEAARLHQIDRRIDEALAILEVEFELPPQPREHALRFATMRGPHFRRIGRDLRSDVLHEFLWCVAPSWDKADRGLLGADFDFVEALEGAVDVYVEKGLVYDEEGLTNITLGQARTRPVAVQDCGRESRGTGDETWQPWRLAREARLNDRLQVAFELLTMELGIDRFTRARLVSQFRAPRFRRLAPADRARFAEELALCLGFFADAATEARVVEAFTLVEWAERLADRYLQAMPVDNGKRRYDPLRELWHASAIPDAAARVMLARSWVRAGGVAIDTIAGTLATPVLADTGGGAWAGWIRGGILGYAPAEARVAFCCVLADRLLADADLHTAHARAAAALLSGLDAIDSHEPKDLATRIAIATRSAAAMVRTGDRAAASRALEQAAGLPEGEFPSPESMARQALEAGERIDAGNVAYLAATWLASKRLPWEEFTRLAREILAYLAKVRARLLASAGVAESAAFDARVESIYLAIAGASAERSRGCADRGDPAGAAEALAFLADLVEELHNELAGGADMVDDGPLPSAFAWSDTAGPVGLDADPSEPYLDQIRELLAGRRASLPIARLSALAVVRPGSAPRAPSSPAVPPSSRPTSACPRTCRGAMPGNVAASKAWEQALGGPSDSGGAVWIGVHLLGSRYWLYAVEWPPSGDRPSYLGPFVGPSREAVSRAKQAFERYNREVWADHDGTRDAGGTRPEVELAGRLGEAVADWIGWTNDLFSAPMASLWREHWAGSHIILAPSASAWGLPLDFVGVGDARRIPVFHRARTVRWALGRTPQARMNWAAQRSGCGDPVGLPWLVCSTLPRVSREVADPEGFVEDPSVQGMGPAYLVHRARTELQGRPGLTIGPPPGGAGHGAQLRRELARGPYREVILMGHGTSDGDLLLDEPIEHLISAARIAKLGLASCQLGMIDDRSPAVTMSRGFISRTLAGGAQVGSLLAYRTLVPDLVAADLTFDLMRGANLAADRVGELRRMFPLAPGEPPGRQLIDALAVGEHPFVALRRAVLAMSVAFAGLTPEPESAPGMNA